VSYVFTCSFADSLIHVCTILVSGSGDQLSAGSYLTVGQCLTTPDGLEQLCYQAADGLACASLVSTGVSYWCSNAGCKSCGFISLMGMTADSCVFALWSTATTPSQLLMQSNGNLVALDVSNAAYWLVKAWSFRRLFPFPFTFRQRPGPFCSSFNPFPCFRFVSLIFVGRSTSTSGSGNYLTISNGGNVIIYGNTNVILWQW
jgi:hypothetical protein